MILTNVKKEEIQEELLSPLEIAKEIPLNQEHRDSIQQWRNSVIDILTGKDKRLLLIVGPCSIHDRAVALEYGQKLKRVAERLSERFFIVMRTYFEKPRTIMGWKGFLHDPDLDGSHDFIKGIRAARSLLVDLTEMGMPCASELLEVTTPYYYADFLTWGCIGARTSSSQPHRELASLLPFPIGFKNSINGDIYAPIHGIMAASFPQTFIGVGSSGYVKRIASQGNPYCHLVLRGSSYGSNCGSIDLERATLACMEAGITPSLMVDCSHDNSKKDPYKQIVIFKELLAKNSVRALMLESNLYGGSQKITSSLSYGISVTDPCLSWSATEELLFSSQGR